ncbi:protein-tyrosine sulfotransferase 1-like isoform X2 [Amphiura filiformis]|uniref:protein-tyrosine sulfotransferase 1-like isoform X2 n=1 Tax=Amphiura filiformis TaxID=82378 RepID=UPI003B212CE5
MIANSIVRHVLRDMARYSKIRTLATVFATASITFLLLQSTCDEKKMMGGLNNQRMVQRSTDHVIKDKQTDKEYEYSRDMPLIFIGGMPRSGTTLMRAMLDAHPDVRCGEETRVIPRLLSMRQQWRKSVKEHARLLEAGLTDPVIDDALTAFILEIIAKHGDPAPRLCNKDPFTLKSMTYLHDVFPHGQYLLMIRDGRATVHSIIERKVTITGFDITSYRDCLKKWNTAVESMYNQCLQVGPQWCLPVYYEQLVLHPEEWMRKILGFLKVDWDTSVLHHEDAIGKPGGISLSRRERSTDQVVKPVNLEALSKWVGKIPKDVIDDMAKLAPMLARLGYDPRANPPNYGKPDKFVLDNEDRIMKNNEKWQHNMQQVQEQKKVVDKLLEQEKQRDKVEGKDPSYIPPQDKRPSLNIAKLQQDTREKQGPRPHQDEEFANNGHGERRPNPKFAKRAEGPYPALR